MIDGTSSTCESRAAVLGARDHEFPLKSDMSIWPCIGISGEVEGEQ